MYYGEYFDWLCDLVKVVPGKYDILMGELYRMEFVWALELDGNRAEDGLIIRYDYHAAGGSDWSNEGEPCSVLEALIGIAGAMDYILDDEDRGDRRRIWFWELIHNLGLDKFTDEYFEGLGSDRAKWGELGIVHDICDRWMNRKFSYYGRGSPFPLFTARRDQRKLQIIDQMNDYILEKYVKDDEIL